ncbi:MAG: glycosyltransferase [Pirellulaceae bacterium]
MYDAIVTAPGSLGDVNPMLAIARILQADGKRVIFLAAEQYLHLAERAGLETHPLFDRATFDDFVSDPKLWHPRHGARQIFQKAVNSVLRTHYGWLEQNCVPGQTMLVSHLLDFAGRIYRDKYPNTSCVSVLPAPAPLRSFTEPPRVSSYSWEPWIPRSWLPLAYWAADQWVDRIGAVEINALRSEIGLQPIRRMLHKWWYSPDMVLCLFPAWFSIPKVDLHPQMRLVGFPLADSHDVVEETIHAELQDILERIGGEQPIVFAPGTANHHGHEYLTHAVAACRELGRAAILISNDPRQIPSNLPDKIYAARYLPFSQLLPRAAAIVHHGGVGTTSQAFSAGIPQIVLPMAFDQFDNANRVATLQCGSWLPMRRLNKERLKRQLSAMPQVTAGVDRVQSLISQQPPFSETIQRLLRVPLESASQASTEPRPLPDADQESL